MRSLGVNQIAGMVATSNGPEFPALDWNSREIGKIFDNPLVHDTRRIVFPHSSTGNGIASLLEFQMLVRYADARHRSCFGARDSIPIAVRRGGGPDTPRQFSGKEMAQYVRLCVVNAVTWHLATDGHATLRR